MLDIVPYDIFIEICKHLNYESYKSISRVNRSCCRNLQKWITKEKWIDSKTTYYSNSLRVTSNSKDVHKNFHSINVDTTDIHYILNVDLFEYARESQIFFQLTHKHTFPATCKTTDDCIELLTRYLLPTVCYFKKKDLLPFENLCVVFNFFVTINKELNFYSFVYSWKSMKDFLLYDYDAFVAKHMLRTLKNVSVLNAFKANRPTKSNTPSLEESITFPTKLDSFLVVRSLSFVFYSASLYGTVVTIVEEMNKLILKVDCPFYIDRVCTNNQALKYILQSNDIFIVVTTLRVLLQEDCFCALSKNSSTSVEIDLFYKDTYRIAQNHFSEYNVFLPSTIKFDFPFSTMKNDDTILYRILKETCQRTKRLIEVIPNIVFSYTFLEKGK